MIANVPKKRADGGSSFASLYNYIRHQVDEKSGEVGFRGREWYSDACLSDDTVAKEMILVETQNPRVADPVFHYILSWPPEETPTTTQWRECVRETLSALGLAEHQAFAVGHSDTEAFHVHVMANRIHPETYKAHAPEWSHYSLDETCRKLERKFGWKEANGLCRWDENLGRPVKTEKHLFEEWRQEKEQSGRAATGKAAKMEHYGDSETLEAYCKAGPAKRLSTLMKQEKGTLSWQTIHTELAHFGLVLHKAERGGFTVSDAGSQNHVKASKVFRALFSGKQAQAWREQVLGEFHPPSDETLSLSKNPLASYEKRVSERDPLMRQIRKEERRQARQELLTRYADEKTSFEQESKSHFERNKAMWVALMKESASVLKEQKKQIRASGRSRDAKQIEIGIATFEHEERCADLKGKIMKGKERSRFLSRDEWAAQEAEKGDDAAIAYLRGQHYARQRKKKLEGQEGDCSIKPSTEGQFDPKVQDFEKLKWFVDRETGFVEYRMGDRTMFVDSGPRIEIKADATDEAILAALKLARSKYGKSIEATGSDELLQRIAEITLRNRLDMDFTNAEMQERVRKIQEVVDVEHPTRQEVLQKKDDASSQKQEIPSSLVLDEEREIQQLVEIARKKMDNAQVKLAFTQDGIRTYGRVFGVTERFVLQHTGKNEFCIHRKDDLVGTKIEVSRNLRVIYENGKGAAAFRFREKTHSYYR